MEPTMADRILTLEEAAAFMRLGPRTLRDWIARGRLKATKTASRGGKFLILESDCIASIRQQQDTGGVDALEGTNKEKGTWPSSSGTAPGTVISLRRTGSELDRLLAQRTKNRH
jgi:excisionase family DNA binding protein